MWIYVGLWDDDKPPEERESWIFVNDFDLMDDNDTSGFKNDWAAYIFSLYWTFTTLTTVGYGDYSGGNTREYLVTLVFEFIGFSYNAVLISIMSSFFDAAADFNDLLNNRMSEMDLWMKRIELSYKPHYLHPKLGKQI